MSECIYENIIAAHDKCQFVTENCVHLSSYINYIQIYYCDLEGSVPLIVLFAIIFSFLVFNIFGAVSDSYLAPALEIICKRLELSESIAGITLLAFAASAPDVVTGIVAGGKEEGGIRIAIGGLFGACLFTVTVVLAGCITGAKEIEADKKALKRDIFALMLALSYFIVLTIIQDVTPLLAAGFFMLYLLFFCYVIFEESRKAKAYASLKENLMSGEEKQEMKIVEDRLSQSAAYGSIKIPDIQILREARSYDDIKRDDMMASVLKIKLKESWRRPSSEIHNNLSVKIPKHPSLRKVKTTNFEGLIAFRQSEENSESSETSVEIEVEHDGLAHRLLKYVNIPILFVGDMTMPPFESERWNRYYAFFAIVLGPLFLAWELGFVQTYQNDWWFWTIFSILTLSIALFIFVQGKKRNFAEEYPFLLSTVTLLISIFWLNLVSTLVVDFLTFIQVITGLSLYFLSITILAWGNSLEDYFVNYTIARKGYGRTSLGGVYGSQIFAIMIGFGGGLFRMALGETIHLDIYNFHESETLRENFMTLFLLGSTFLVLILTLIVGRVSKWVLGRKIVMFVLGFYFLFIIGIVLIAFA